MNISLSSDLKKDVDKAINRGSYSSASEFFRMLFRRWQKEEKLLRELEASRKEVREGKGKVLRSLADLR